MPIAACHFSNYIMLSYTINCYGGLIAQAARRALAAVARREEELRATLEVREAARVRREEGMEARLARLERALAGDSSNNNDG